MPPPAHVAAAKRLMAANVTVLAATSRRPRVVQPQLDQVGLALPAVLIDGALGVDFRSGERFHQACFTPRVALDTLAVFTAHGLEPCLYIDDPHIDVVISGAPSTCADHVAYLGPIAARGDLETTAQTATLYEFAVLGVSRERLDPLAAALASVAGSSVIVYPEPAYGQFGLIVSPPGVSKWTGIAAYCRRHDIGVDEVLAVGDGLNDVAMLLRAGTAVGVRGGAPEVMSASDHLIDPPYADGWTEIVDLVEASGSSCDAR